MRERGKAVRELERRGREENRDGIFRARLKERL